MGIGEIISSSTMQKINLRSSTESDLIGVDDKLSKVLWMKYFLGWKGFLVKLNIVCERKFQKYKSGREWQRDFGKMYKAF